MVCFVNLLRKTDYELINFPTFIALLSSLAFLTSLGLCVHFYSLGLNTGISCPTLIRYKPFFLLCVQLWPHPVLSKL